MTYEEFKKRSEENFQAMEELRKFQEETSRQMRLNDEQIKQIFEAQKQTDEQMKQTDEQMKKTDAKLERMGITLGNVTNNQGEVAEEFFINSLKANPKIGSIQFEIVDSNTKRHIGSMQDEFDILLINGNSVAIVEVKYKVHPNDVDKLDEKITSFRKLFPVYKNYKVYAGIASFKVSDTVVQKLQNKGYFVLQRKGEVVETFTDNLVAA